MIRLNVFIQVSNKNKIEFENIAKELVNASQKENGCIAYDLFMSSTRNDVYMICETWADKTSLKAHEESEHFKTCFPKIQNLSDIKVEKFQF